MKKNKRFDGKIVPLEEHDLETNLNQQLIGQGFHYKGIDREIPSLTRYVKHLGEPVLKVIRPLLSQRQREFVTLIENETPQTEVCRILRLSPWAYQRHEQWVSRVLRSLVKKNFKKNKS